MSPQKSPNVTDVNTSGEEREEPRVNVTLVTDERGTEDNVTVPGQPEAVTSPGIVKGSLNGSPVKDGQPPVAAELRADAAQNKQILVPAGESVTQG